MTGGPPRGRLWNLLEVFLVYLRDKVARPAIGEHDGDRFVPLLWTVFMFILCCNLCGLVPWVGAPTSSFGVTTGLAGVTFATGLVFGVRKFGPLGYFLNQVPHMDLPFPMGLVIKPMILAIELLGLCIKHVVLAIRLLANMFAGHLVLLGIMGLAFGASAAISFVGAPNWQWWVTATIAVVASTLFSCLELFVAFLQAYVFTFLSALFIGAAIHHH
jgi:F-type H+-transporting ATPase subunit a